MVAVRMVEVEAVTGGAPTAVLLLLSAVFLHGATAVLSLSKKCGDLSCRPTEYCSQFDKRCHGCESVCEESSHNFQEDVCHRDCQDYLHDLRYARVDGERGESNVEGLKEAVLRLTRLAVASLAVSVILLVAFAAFVCFLWCRTNRASAHADDSEAGHRGQQARGLASYLHAKIAASKGSRKGGKTGGMATHAPAHGLKLDMTAAGGGVAASSGNGRQTPQPQAPPPPERPPAGTPTTAGGKSEVTGAYSPTTTASTPLSTRPPRYPSEDTTLDYAYDNRALTPSPRLEGGPHPPTPFHRPQTMGGVKGGETTF
ncbi:protein grindelwald [Hetaerina americana]|uniref:protein grindelwald n=1 Tax=Hetaerina americana TaxID=62018 RepID=UPI003A7F2F95